MTVISLTRTGRGLVGTVGARRVHLEYGNSSRGRITGECVGARVDGYWRIESNVSTLNPVGLFLGEYDGSPVYLRNEVQLTARYLLEHAELTGLIGDQELHAWVAPTDALANGATVVGIDGNFGSAIVTLFATIEGDLSWARLSGVVGGDRVHVDATPGSVAGTYTAVPALLPLLLGSLLYFI